MIVNPNEGRIIKKMAMNHPPTPPVTVYCQPDQPKGFQRAEIVEKKAEVRNWRKDKISFNRQKMVFTIYCFL